MDVCESGGGDLAGVRGQIPPGAREPFAGQAQALSLQKPERRASQRDEEAIRRWKEERWPHLKRGP